MVRAVPDILARIVEHKRAELARDLPQRAELERRAAARSDYRDFKGALTAHPPSVIGEIKKASPSKGVFTDRFDPASNARMYASGGAAALSVLTDREFFHGSLADLEIARAAVSVSVLRKDFTLDEFHVIEAAAHGADAVLLIVALLEERALRDLRELASRYRMAALVEVHDDFELQTALASGAAIVGVNNRNLHTFEVSLDHTLRLRDSIPDECALVSESGIKSRADVERLQSAGVDAILVGESLMREPDIGTAVDRLLGR